MILRCFPKEDAISLCETMMQMIAPVLAESNLYAWVVLPLLIFLARICDVTLGTVRLIFVSRGFKYLAPLVGFVERGVFPIKKDWRYVGLQRFLRPFRKGK